MSVQKTGLNILLSGILLILPAESKTTIKFIKHIFF